MPDTDPLARFRELVEQLTGAVAALSFNRTGAHERYENAYAALLAEAERLVEALAKIEAHHVEQNQRKGRDESRSTTLRIVREALHPDPGGLTP